VQERTDTKAPLIEEELPSGVVMTSYLIILSRTLIELAPFPGRMHLHPAASGFQVILGGS
jgi:hypothetical protein